MTNTSEHMKAKAEQFQSGNADFNQKALELLEDAAVLAQHQGLTELILIASSENDVLGQVMTDSPVGALLKMITMVNSTAEQLGPLLTLEPENLALLKEESEKLQQSLAKL